MALPGSRIVVQQPAFEEPLQGQPSDLEIQAQELLRLRDQLARMLVRHTGQTSQRIAADLERDTIFDAVEAKRYGLVDHVIKNRKTSLSSHGSR